MFVYYAFDARLVHYSVSYGIISDHRPLRLGSRCYLTRLNNNHKNNVYVPTICYTEIAYYNNTHNNIVYIVLDLA